MEPLLEECADAFLPTSLSEAEATTATEDAVSIVPPAKEDASIVANRDGAIPKESAAAVLPSSHDTEAEATPFFKDDASIVTNGAVVWPPPPRGGVVP